MKIRSRTTQLARRAADIKRVVFVEYIVLLGAVVLAAGLALHGLGVPMVQSFYLTKLFILLPVP